MTVPTPRRIDVTDLLGSVLLCLTVALGFLFAVPEWSHWALVPVTLCGVAIGVDAVRVVRGRLDILDPVGVIGLVGLHFFFLAPLLHVATRYWMWLEPVAQPLDWRPWVGLMAALNLLGILMYRLGRIIRFPTPRQPTPRRWTVHNSRIYVFAAVLLPVSLLLQMYVYQKFGGVYGYIVAFGEGSTEFQGMGPVFMLSEIFPFILFMAGVALFRGRKVSRSYLFVALVLVLLLVLRIYFGGLRGSRANYVWYMVWMGAVSHVYFRKIQFRHVVPVIVLVVLFSTFYWYYKVLGAEMFSEEGRAGIERYESHRGGVLTSVLLGDLGRADVQAFVLYQTLLPDVYDPAQGQTYLYGLLLPLPDVLVPLRPRGKVAVGTEALYGRGHRVPGGTMSSRVYGLAGEAMLNFGPAAVPVAFLLLGLFVGAVQRARNRIPPGDARHILYPFVMVVCLQFLYLDLENVVYYVITVGVPPLLIVWSSSLVRQGSPRPTTVRAAPPAGVVSV